MKFIKKFLRDESGATAIEYGLIAALIAVAIMSVMSGIANEVPRADRVKSADQTAGK